MAEKAVKPLSKYISHATYINRCIAHLHNLLIYHPFQPAEHKQPVTKSQKEEVLTSMEADAPNLQPEPDVENGQTEDSSYSQQDAPKTIMQAKDHELEKEVQSLPEVLLKEEEVCIFKNYYFDLSN